MKWSFCTLVTAFQERYNWHGEDIGTDNLNDQSNEGIEEWTKRLVEVNLKNIVNEQ